MPAFFVPQFISFSKFFASLDIAFDAVKHAGEMILDVSVQHCWFGGGKYVWFPIRRVFKGRGMMLVVCSPCISEVCRRRSFPWSSPAPAMEACQRGLRRCCRNCLTSTSPWRSFPRWRKVRHVPRTPFLTASIAEEGVVWCLSSRSTLGVHLRGKALRVHCEIRGRLFRPRGLLCEPRTVRVEIP